MPDSPATPAPVVVIGGGISGLACAFRLQQHGIPALLFEKSDRVGGVISAEQKDGFLFEFGPQGVLLTAPVAELVEAAGMTGEMIRANPHATRFILHRGKLVPAPMSPLALLRSPLLDARTKWRLATEPLRRTHPPEGDESVAAFVRRKFGTSLLENIVAPFVSGVYAGDPELLSLRAAFPQVHEWECENGSVLRGAIRQMRKKSGDGSGRPGLMSFRGGVTSLLEALAARLGDKIQYAASIISLSRNDPPVGAAFTLQVERGGATETLLASAAVIATEPDAAALLAVPIAPQAAAALQAIHMAPVTMVTAGYRREDVANSLEGFGFLVPRKEGLRTLGTIWNSSLFPGRAPAGHVSMTSFVGGATDPEIATWPDDKVAATVHAEMARVSQIRGTPVLQRLRRYDRALPQYNLGHSGRIAAIEQACRAIPGLFIAGNYLDGPSFGACIERAFAVAGRIEKAASGAPTRT